MSDRTTGFHDPLFVRYYEQTDNTRQIDLTFWLDLARKTTGRILDAGCGSGRTMIGMLEAGAVVDGFDSSPVMLEEISARLSQKGLTARVWLDDLETFTAEPGSYSLIICAFNTFLHLMTHEAQIAALTRFREALAPDGELVFDITNPLNFDIFSRRAIGRTFESTMYDGATDSETTIWRWFERDLIAQTGAYHREYETVSKTGSETHKTQVQFRWTYTQEMKLLLRLAGFTNFEVTGDYTDQPLTEESEMQVWRAWR